ncbi:DEAD/DEAH box helicase [Aeoliella sp. SH292]|uniref:DEAD/DEAH box helicase n=1 Tax=Aeoliella sp. SH292 TaxID=3454464 RepID=UPI003F94EE73
MDVAKLLNRITSRPDYNNQLEHIEELAERPAQFAAPATPLPPAVTRLLKSRGIEQLYTHQVEALESARAGRDTVVVTGTASGKTLCYNLPILETVVNEPGARALYFFPTKALAQDQLKGMLALVEGDAEMQRLIRPGVYDGDTPTAQRRRIRNEANLVLTNPDMLHAGILPYHPKWATLFADLRYIVIDEVHTYRGILGAHVSAVLRRLERVCRHYGSNPIYLATSATIANPGELVSSLLGRDVQVVDQDGSPRGRKFFALWNPSPLGSDSLARRSANDDAVTWLTEAMEAGGQALAFTRTRQAAELVHRYARQTLAERHSPLADSVRAYRGGYLPNERRQMEQDLFAGKLRGVATTNALELGIDIGSLDVAILVGYPGTIASSWQQAGRSGRRADESLAVMLAGNEPVDQYLLRHPEYFFAQSPEHAVVDPNNPYVLAKHLKAAAFELPLDAADLELFGPLAEPIAGVLADERQLTKVDDAYFCPGGQNPTVGVSLRHMSDNTFSIVLLKHTRISRDLYTSGSPPLVDDSHEVIANVDSISAPELVYPEAVYLHAGETYLVRELDLNGKVAYVERRETDYYTQAVLESNVLITKTRDTSTALPTAELGYGEVDVSWQTVAFKKIKFDTRENIGLGPVDIPAQNLATTGVWLAPTDEVRKQLKAEGLRSSEGVCGMRNLAVVALPFVAMCDSRDLGGVVDAKNLGRSTMILYDRYPGGLGYCQKGFEHMAKLLEICLEMVADCPCDDGCPSCVGLPNLRPAIHSDPDLTRGHPIPNKQATQRLLELLLNREPSTRELVADVVPSPRPG